MTPIVLATRSWLGTPYVHQASVKGAGTDCLGLIRGVWRDVFGQEPEEVPAYTQDWSEASGKEVLWQAARRRLRALPQNTPLAEGQVLLFRMRDGMVAKHLGLVSRVEGVPAFIHAYSGQGVVESSLSTAWRRRIVARFDFPAIPDQEM